MAHPKDITGKKFGKLTAVRMTSKRNSQGAVIWVFRCECGTQEKELAGSHVSQGLVVSCGCFQRLQAKKSALRSKGRRVAEFYFERLERQHEADEYE